MTPNLSKKQIPKIIKQKTIASNINKLKMVEKNFEYVGDKFQKRQKNEVGEIKEKLFMEKLQ